MLLRFQYYRSKYFSFRNSIKNFLKKIFLKFNENIRENVIKIRREFEKSYEFVKKIWNYNRKSLKMNFEIVCICRKYYRYNWRAKKRYFKNCSNFDKKNDILNWLIWRYYRNILREWRWFSWRFRRKNENNIAKWIWNKFVEKQKKRYRRFIFLFDFCWYNLSCFSKSLFREKTFDIDIFSR